MTNQRWPAEKNIEFIAEYERYECLWDPKHAEYKNRDARNAAYQNIQDVMQMESVKDVISKIRSLRNTYNCELTKAKKRMSKGVGKPYISKIPWLPYMEFLTNIDGYARESIGSEIPSHFHEILFSEESGKEIVVPPPPPRPPAPLAMKRKVKDEGSTIRSVNVLENVPSQHLYEGNDEFDLFGKTIAQQLRQLPLEMALETEELILSTVRHQRILLLSNPESSSKRRVLTSPKREPTTKYSDKNGAQSESESE